MAEPTTIPTKTKSQRPSLDRCQGLDLAAAVELQRFTTKYDEEDRLTTWGRTDGDLNRDWEFSLVGDWDSVTDNNGAPVNYDHNEAHELLSVGGNVTTQYDRKGNRTQHRPPNFSDSVYDWDFNNQLRGVFNFLGSNEPPGFISTSMTHWDVVCPSEVQSPPPRPFLCVQDRKCSASMTSSETLTRIRILQLVVSFMAVTSMNL